MQLMQLMRFYYFHYLMISSLANLYGKELENKDPKKIDNTLLVNTRFKLIDKKIKKGIQSILGSGITQ